MTKSKSRATHVKPKTKTRAKPKAMKPRAAAKKPRAAAKKPRAAAKKPKATAKKPKATKPKATKPKVVAKKRGAAERTASPSASVLAAQLEKSLRAAGYPAIKRHKTPAARGSVRVEFGGWGVTRKGTPRAAPHRYKALAHVNDKMVEIKWAGNVASAKTVKLAVERMQAKGLKPKRGALAAKTKVAPRPKTKVAPQSKTKMTKTRLAGVTRIFRELRTKMARGCPVLETVGLQVQTGIHDTPRHFAQTGQLKRAAEIGAVTVAVAPELADQLRSVIRGVLVHELGHAAVLLGYAPLAKKTATLSEYTAIERQADKVGEKLSGLRVYYDKGGVQRAGPGALGKRPRPKGLR